MTDAEIRHAIEQSRIAAAHIAAAIAESNRQHNDHIRRFRSFAYLCKTLWSHENDRTRFSR